MTIEIIRPANREAWLAARRPAVTASVAGCLLGVHPYQTAYGLWALKSGLVADIVDDNDVLRRGRLLEPVIFAMLREDYPEWTVDYPLGDLFFHDRAARIGATPDSFATRPDIYGQGTVQGKTVAWSDYERDWLDPDTGEVVLPLWIAVQAIVEASLTGSTWAAVAILIIDQRVLELKVVDIPLEMAPRIMARLRAAVVEFWDMVASGREPEPDWLRDADAVLEVYRDSLPDRRDLTNDTVLDDLIGRYVEARETRLMVQKIEDSHRPQIIRVMGKAEAAFTTNWQFTARTSVREDGTKTRVLRVKPREDFHADRF